MAAVTVGEVPASRVCIQADRHGDPVVVDVVLPSSPPLGELLPTIVGFVDGGAFPGDTAVRWRLDHPSIGRLDPSLSLIDNGIRDGDLLLLDTDGARSLGPLRRTAPQVVTHSQPPRRVPGHAVASWVCLLATALAAVVLASAVGSATATTSALLAAAGTIAAAVVAVAAGHPTASSVAVVILAGVTGFLAVPSGPAAPNVFLGATAALCAALLAMRLSGRTSMTLVALSALSLPVAAVTLVALPATAAGAALSTVSLSLLAVAPRAAVLAGRLGPDHWHDGVEESAAVAHVVLSGLVAGSAAGTAAGATVLVVAGQRGPTAGAATLAGVVAAILLLRSRTYVDADRQITLLAGGVANAIACLCLVLILHPTVAGPIAGMLILVGLAALRRPRCGSRVTRVLNRLEYVALAAVVPVACWVGGVYTALGGIGR